MLIFATIILYTNHVWQAHSSDIPKSHVPVLDELLSKYLNKTSATQISIVDVLFGESNMTEDIMQNLDINIINHKSLKNIIEKEKEGQFRRLMNEYPEDYIQNKDNRVLKNKLFQLMQQSIYSARYRLAETKLLRIKFKEDNLYNIGIIVANVYQLILKCEHMYNQMLRLTVSSFFLWHLQIYEKILACHTDVEDLVRRAFVYQAKHEESMADFDIDNSAIGSLGNNGSNIPNF